MKLENFNIVLNTYKESANMEDFLKLIDKFLVRVENDNFKSLDKQEELSILKSSFNDEYKKFEYFEKLYEFVKSLINKQANRKIHFPLGSICQGSGYGKSRAMKELAKLEISIYLCFRDKNEFGFPERSYLTDHLLKYLDTIQQDKFWHALVLTSLEYIEKLADKMDLKNDVNRKIVAKKFMNFQPWDGNNNKFNIEFNQRVLKNMEKHENGYIPYKVFEDLEKNINKLCKVKFY